jgi:hypothetical protein
MGHEEIFIFVVCFFANAMNGKSSFGKSKPFGGRMKRRKKEGKKFIAFLILSLLCVYVEESKNIIFSKRFFFFLLSLLSHIFFGVDNNRDELQQN